MPTFTRSRMLRNPLPEGSMAVGAGLLVFGVTAYGFLVISARALGPERYAGLSVLWALVYLAGPGLFLPLEQEVARVLADRRSRGVGAGRVVRRASIVAAVAASFMALAVVAGSGALGEALLDHDGMLVAGFAVGIVAYAGQYLARGTLSGTGRFGTYGALLAAEGSVRLAVCAALALLGVSTAGPYGLALGIAPAAALAILIRSPVRLEPGPDAAWSELSSALGYLLASSLLAQFLVNAGPLAVKLLAAEADEAQAGRFLASLVIARVPLFLFQAVQASLLPKLAALAGASRAEAFRRGLRRLLGAVAAIGLAGALGSLLLGPWVVRILFGEAFALGRQDLVLLALGTAAYMLALSLAQALIALRGHRVVAVGWLVGAVWFVAVTAAAHGLLLRVELGFLAGSIAAAAAMGLALRPRLRAAEAAWQPHAEPPEPVWVEP